MHTEKNDMVFHMEKTGMLILLVEINVGGMTADVVDKLTCSSNGWQLKQVDRKSIHALYEPHLDDIRVVPNMHEVHQRFPRWQLVGVTQLRSWGLLGVVGVAGSRDEGWWEKQGRRMYSESEEEDEVESTPEIERKTVASSMDKEEIGRPKQNVKPARRLVKYVEMYRTQRPRGNQRNWNNLKSHQLALITADGSYNCWLMLIEKIEVNDGRLNAD
uniref:Uncharacterized protein n=1 Tax=Tanacetum cinerariifolium TaxID=118510 RepID=A0A6L2KJW9_TANCI|nr:hypothetical protein [Tanacetum cinerariifolium]